MRLLGPEDSLSLKTPISGSFRGPSATISASLLGGNPGVGVDVVHPGAILGSTNLTNCKLASDLLLCQLKLILARLPLFTTNLTKLLTVGLNRRKGAFTNRANQAWVARASDAKASLDKRHVDCLVPARSRIDAIFTHLATDSRHIVGEKLRITAHEISKARHLGLIMGGCRGKRSDPSSRPLTTSRRRRTLTSRRRRWPLTGRRRESRPTNHGGYGSAHSRNRPGKTSGRGRRRRRLRLLVKGRP